MAGDAKTPVLYSLQALASRQAGARGVSSGGLNFITHQLNQPGKSSGASCATAQGAELPSSDSIEGSATRTSLSANSSPSLAQHMQYTYTYTHTYMCLHILV